MHADTCFPIKKKKEKKIGEKHKSLIEGAVSFCAKTFLTPDVFRTLLFIPE